MLKNIPDMIADARKSLETITIDEAVVRCKAENGIMIDVREPEEFNQKSAKGVINIPRGLIEMKMLQTYSDENLPIFIHCATGARATFAAEQLKRVGYKNIWVITCPIEHICTTML